jgi:hypothetical protein
MEKMWKEMAMTNFKMLSHNSPGGTEGDQENTPVLIADLREKIRGRELLTVKQEH